MRPLASNSVISLVREIPNNLLWLIHYFKPSLIGEDFYLLISNLLTADNDDVITSISINYCKCYCIRVVHSFLFE